MPKTIFSQEQEALQRLLKEKRSALELTQAALAERLGKPQSFVSKYESGERLLDVVEFRRVVIALGISFPDFAKELENKLNSLKK